MQNVVSCAWEEGMPSTTENGCRLWKEEGARLGKVEGEGRKWEGEGKEESEKEGRRGGSPGVFETATRSLSVDTCCWWKLLVQLRELACAVNKHYL